MSDSDILLKILTHVGNMEKKVSRILTHVINLEKRVSRIEKLVSSTKKSQFNIKIKDKKDKPQKKSKSSKNKKSKSPKCSKKTLMTEYNNKLLLHGNTYDYRETIKQNGGFWNKELKGWILPIDSKEKISEDITEIVVNSLEKDLEYEGSPVNSYKKTEKKVIGHMCFIDSDSD